jgi:hypothetical protein
MSLCSCLRWAALAFLRLLSWGLISKREVLTESSTAWPARLRSFLDGCACIDFIGAGLFIAGVTSILPATSWGGSAYAWASPAVLIPLIVSPFLLVFFLIYQRYMGPGQFLARRLPRTIPVVPYHLFHEKDVTLVCIISAATGAALHACFYFASIYFTVVENYDAGKASLQLLFYVPGTGVGAYTTISCATSTRARPSGPFYSERL